MQKIYIVAVLTDVKVHLFVWTRRLTYNFKGYWGYMAATAGAITLVVVAGTIYWALLH